MLEGGRRNNLQRLHGQPTWHAPPARKSQPRRVPKNVLNVQGYYDGNIIVWVTQACCIIKEENLDFGCGLEHMQEVLTEICANTVSFQA